MKTGIELIAEERQEQIEKHEWMAKHDDKHDDGSLINAALICASDGILYRKKEYAHNTTFDKVELHGWKLPIKYNGNILIANYKSTKKERIHQLKVAGALIAAEIDRLNRQ